MTTKKIVVSVIFAALFSASVGAQTTSIRLSREYESCMDNVKRAPDVLACAEPEIERQMVALNKTMERIYATLDEDMKPRLVSDQKAWEAYVNNHCDIIHAYMSDDGLCSVYAYAARIDSAKALESYFDAELKARNSSSNNVSKPPVR